VSKTGKRLFILIASDDPEERSLFEEALAAAEVPHLLHTTGSGEKLISFLENAFKKGQPFPDLIFLDLPTDKGNGREALELIKRTDSPFRQIPVIMIAISGSATLVDSYYRLGANICITKPSGFGELSKFLRELLTLFIGTVRLPSSLPSQGKR